MALAMIISRIEDSAQSICKDISEDVQRKARANTDKFRYDYPEAPPPGRLASSIVVDGPIMEYPGRYKAGVGPTVVYGAQREWGGWIFPRTSPYLYFRFQGHGWKARQVYQQEYKPLGRYLGPAGLSAEQDAVEIAVRHLTAAIEEA